MIGNWLCDFQEVSIKGEPCLFPLRYLEDRYVAWSPSVILDKASKAHSLRVAGIKLEGVWDTNSSV